MNKETIQKFYFTYRLYIFPTAVGFCCLILIALIILPQFISLLDLRKSEEQNLKRSGILEAKAAELESFNPQDVQKKVEIALNVFPKDKDYTGALTLVQTTMSQNSFIVNSISPSKTASTAPGGGGQSYTLKATAIGPKLFLYDLIKAIENGSRVMRIQSIEMTPQHDDSAVSVVLAIDVLFSDASAKSNNTDSPIPKLTSSEEQLINKLAALAPSSNNSNLVISGDGQLVDIGGSGGGARGKQNPFK